MASDFLTARTGQQVRPGEGPARVILAPKAQADAMAATLTTEMDKVEGKDFLVVYSATREAVIVKESDTIKNPPFPEPRDGPEGNTLPDVAEMWAQWRGYHLKNHCELCNVAKEDTPQKILLAHPDKTKQITVCHKCHTAESRRDEKMVKDLAALLARTPGLLEEDVATFLEIFKSNDCRRSAYARLMDHADKGRNDLILAFVWHFVHA